ncbi:PRC-barrel domain-containing protein [Bacillota bacterium LX-D]|nr:PRC-barrel domain-containing protein [Bacillota bacterium LX-D]
MYPSRKLLAMPVLSIEDGEILGKVKDIVIDAKALNIAALVLEQKGNWFKEAKVITYEHINTIGDDAITVVKSKCIEKASALPQIMQLVHSGIPIIGTRVLTESGSFLGTVDEFLFDPATGHITLLEIADKLMDNLLKGKAFLSTDLLSTVGKDAIIAQKGAEKNLERHESSIQGTVKTVKEAGSKMWQQTVTKTKKLGESLKKLGIEEVKKPHAAKQKSVDEVNKDENENTVNSSKPN